MNARQTVQTGIRCLSVMMVISLAAIMVWWTCKATLDTIELSHRMTHSPWPRFFSRFWSHIYDHALPWIVTLGVLAVGLWLGQKRLARLIAPELGRTCPECGYSLRNRDVPGCPECGAGMPPTSSSAERAPDDDSARG